jgi:type IV pilus assembly protein PilA
MPSAKKVFGILLVIVAILFVAAILIPCCLRTKIADGREPAVGTLRTISSANQTYSATYENGFATNLSQLDGFGTGTGDCDHALLIDSATASGRKYDYIYTYAAKPSPNPPAKGCSQTGASAFSVNADPIKPSAEHQYFFIDETGVLRVEKNKPASASSPPIQ